ncbi:E3 ubiquitin-protein ligase TRIM39-like isoform X2 [Pleurodeles waltl]|uniref:E3 ubiquitin-protein ligase TRIM39-like isoform X2 n=1 Tax=Pleurodeles waltl TaxID=8319 RepID=UPI00370994C8
MAAAQLTGLRDEATCSICLEYFTDPVSTECGHVFCRSCITQSWEGRDGNSPCPQCREISPGRSLRPNRQLGNMVEMLKQLHLPPVKPPEENLCEKHEERLRLFCEEDQRMICVVCRESKDHKSHTVSPIEEAAEECKVKLQGWLCPLRKEMEYILESKLREEEQCNTMRSKVRAEKQNIATQIEQLHRLLRDEEQALCRRLEEMEKTITMIENANISKLSNQITSLNALITDLEKKCEESALDLLRDVRSALDRCKKVKFQGPEQVKRRKVKDIMKIQTPEEEMKKYKVMVTLDPDTAHPRLLLSEGRTSVSGTDRAQPLPDTPKRFTSWACVLGSEGFTSGRHYWEVQLLQGEEGWAVGVAAESVERKGGIIWSPEGGVWAVRRWNDQYSALTSPETRLSPREKPLKLGVYLDYEGGRLSMYNADSMELLYTFPQARFTRRLFPIFYVWGAELRLV